MVLVSLALAELPRQGQIYPVQKSRAKRRLACSLEDLKSLIYPGCSANELQDYDVYQDMDEAARQVRRPSDPQMCFLRC